MSKTHRTVLNVYVAALLEAELPGGEVYDVWMHHDDSCPMAKDPKAKWCHCDEVDVRVYTDANVRIYEETLRTPVWWARNPLQHAPPPRRSS